MLDWTDRSAIGFTAPGTFQEYVLTDAHYATRRVIAYFVGPATAEYVNRIPEGVKDEEAGPIMCGGVSMRHREIVLID